MRLLVFTQKVDQNDPDLGFFVTWIQKIAERVDRVIVICLKRGSYHVPANVTVMSLGKETRVSRFWYLWNFYRYLWRERTAYDAVFVHMNPEYAILGGPIWRIQKKKVVLWYTHRVVNWRLRIAEKFATKIFTASKESFRLPSLKRVITGHGIDVSVFCLRGSLRLGDMVKLLWVGRISPVKDLETVVRAIAFLKKNVIHCSLDIVGAPITRIDEEYEKTIRELVHALSLDDVVHFLGGVAHAEMPSVYASHHALIHTSKTGSIDKVMLEALAAGLTVFSSSDAAESCGDVLTRFPANDSKILAQAIEEFGESAILEPNRRGREFVEKHHSLPRLLDRIVSYVNSEESLDRHPGI